MSKLMIQSDLYRAISNRDVRELEKLTKEIDSSYTKAHFRKDVHKLFRSLCNFRFGVAQNTYAEMSDRVSLVLAQKEVCAAAKTPSGLKMPVAPWGDDGSPRFATELQKNKPSFYPTIAAVALGAVSLHALFYSSSSQWTKNLDAISQTSLLSAGAVFTLKPNLFFLPALERQSVAAGLVGMAAGTVFGAPLISGLTSIAAAKVYNVYNAYKTLS